MKADKWYMLFLLSGILAVSQALSPVPYISMLASLLLLNWSESYKSRMKLGHVAVACLGATPIVFMSWNLDAITITRLVSSCILLILISSLDHGAKASYSFGKLQILILISLGLSAIGFLYALAGGPPIYSVTNPDGREALLFLTTFSNSVFPSAFGSVIRPSFIYDEPGAYAFVIDTVLLCQYLRHGHMTRIDWVVLSAGFITFSLAHMVVAFFILVGERKLLLLFLVGVAIVLVDLYLYAQSGVSLVVERLSFSEGLFAGDNRSELMRTASSIVAQDSFGAGAGCHWNVQECIDQFGPFGENPLFPAAFFGIFPSFLYYAMLIAAAFSTIIHPHRKYACAALACTVLWSQRPFLFSLGYNALIILTFCIMMESLRRQLRGRQRRMLRPTPMPAATTPSQHLLSSNS